MNENNSNYDDEDEDPIVAEVRKARQEIFARCNYDLAELFEYLRARTEESARAGRKVISPPPRKPENPPAKKAG